MTKIINVGCRYYKNNPDKTGGVVVLFEQWLSYCKSIQKKDIEFVTIDSNKSNYPLRIWGLISIIKSIYREVKHSKNRCIVFLHCTLFDLLLINPIVHIIIKKYKSVLCIRKFGGSFKEIYGRYPFIIKKYIDKTLTKNNINFWESKSLVAFGHSVGANSYWFPNVRDTSKYARPKDRPYGKRLVFISRVDKDKGVVLLSECVKNLGKSYSLDIFGPINNLDSSDFTGKNVRYKGCLDPAQVQETLCNYDVLCLPTNWKGEGYPGIIIEAFSVGLPVISTYKGGIPELIYEGLNGFLIPPGDIRKLEEAILKVNEENYTKLSQGAKASFSQFNAKIINPQILNKIMDDNNAV